MTDDDPASSTVSCRVRSGPCSPTWSRRAPRTSGRAGSPAPRPDCWDWPLPPSTAARVSGSPSWACSCARSVPARSTCPSARRWSAGCCTLVRCGTPEQQELFVPRIAGGDLLVAPALNEVGYGAPGATLDPARGRPADRTQDRGPGVRRAPGRHHAPDGHRLRRIRRSGRRARRPGERRRRTHAQRRARAAGPRRPTSSTARRCSVCSATERSTCSTSTSSPVRCCRVTDSSPVRGT